jgi:hypothetical protein
MPSLQSAIMSQNSKGSPSGPPSGNNSSKEKSKHFISLVNQHFVRRRDDEVHRLKAISFVNSENNQLMDFN